ncbi:hypothetical protein CRM22_004095 [Opisthorchis felineus]|uniref:BZIP domain-containing protein n=1 Tax=Opisthorchis felineus TaxID=147828 RepID=A0A4S2M349_OPIFE|nr:hypothetical protein CRM22_004095 [Opisthorchis felineus]
MATLRTEKPSVVHPTVVVPTARSHHPSQRQAHGQTASSHRMEQPLMASSNIRSSLSTSSVAAHINGSVNSGINGNGGFSLASAIAGILGLSFPSSNGPGSTGSSTTGPDIRTSAMGCMLPDSDLFNSSKNTALFNSSSTSSVAANAIKAAVLASVNNGQTNNISPLHIATPSSYTTESNQTQFGLSFAPQQQTCSDVSSETGSTQSPFQPSHNANSIAQYGMSNAQKTATGEFDAADFEASYGSYTTSERDRKQREFIPDSKKDDKYWERRRKNNEAAKRSREKRRQNDILMEHRINILTAQNTKLRHEILELKIRFGLPVDEVDYNDGGATDNSAAPFSNLTSQTPTTNPSNGKIRQSLCDMSNCHRENETDSINGTQFDEPGHPEQLNDALSVSTCSETLTPHFTNGPHPETLNDGHFTGKSSSPDASDSMTAIYSTLSTSPSANQFPTKTELPPIGALNTTDLLALKRIFSTLTAGGLKNEVAPTSTTASVTNEPELISPKSSNGHVQAIPPSLNASAVVAPTPVNNTAAAAWLLQQALLLPPTHLNLPSERCGSNGTGAGTGGVTVVPSAPAAMINQASVLERTSALLKLAGVNSVPGGRNLDQPFSLFETPLDLSLCLPSGLHPGSIDTAVASARLASPTDSRVLDKRYQDRRRRNNEAVRRCRENKRARLMGRAEVTDRLQTENRVLRNELTDLSLEVKALRKLLSNEQTSPYRLAEGTQKESGSEKLENGSDTPMSEEDTCQIPKNHCEQLEDMPKLIDPHHGFYQSHEESSLSNGNQSNPEEKQQTQQFDWAREAYDERDRDEVLSQRTLDEKSSSSAEAIESYANHRDMDRLVGSGLGQMCSSVSDTQEENDDPCPESVKKLYDSGNDHGGQPTPDQLPPRLAHFSRGRRRLTKPSRQLHPSVVSVQCTPNGNDWMDYTTSAGQTLQTCD